jgi:hypothetical protein
METLEGGEGGEDDMDLVEVEYVDEDMELVEVEAEGVEGLGFGGG